MTSQVPLDRVFQLEGKTAAVVGGSGFLCSAIGRAFLEAGMQVAILDPKTPPADLSLRVLHIPADATSKESLQTACDQMVASYGRIDVLLNGATFNAPTPFFEITAEEVEKVLSANVYATLFACQVFGKVMLRQKSGSIINFASASSGPPLSKAFAYSIAKAGVLNLTQNLAREWGTTGVRVNALRPGFFPTEWSLKHFIDEKRKEQILEHTPMRRYGKPEELVGAALWLASEQAKFVTGSVVTVDGGFTAMTI